MMLCCLILPSSAEIRYSLRKRMRSPVRLSCIRWRPSLRERARTSARGICKDALVRSRLSEATAHGRHEKRIRSLLNGTRCLPRTATARAAGECWILRSFDSRARITSSTMSVYRPLSGELVFEANKCIEDHTIFLAAEIQGTGFSFHVSSLLTRTA